MAMAADLTNLAQQPFHDPAHDLIALTNLQLPHGITAPDVWGQAKEQPALVSVDLHLHDSFQSAAGADKLDDSTIHYGTLAKRIRASSAAGQTAAEVSRNVLAAVVEMGRKTGTGGFIVARARVEVLLPKASMYGEKGVGLIHETAYDGEGNVMVQSGSFVVRDVKIMTLVGVNGYERSGRQPLVASLLVQNTADSAATVAALFQLEKLLVEIIQDTSYETLETLAESTISQLREKMLDSLLPGTRIQLRIEKPRAIAWADAPAVQVTRDVPRTKVADAGRGATKSLERLRVVKPYE